jgi:REP element-mobilizing transposase RayT
MPSSWTQNYYHFIFSTKERLPLITNDLHDRLYAFMGGIAKDLGAQLIAGKGMPDHVHLLTRFPPDIAPATLAREYKARSSRWIHETFPPLEAHSWQRGYGGFTVSKSAVPDVEHYIRTQQEHHRTMTFQQEFVQFLEKHGIDYDPRYVFE